MFERVAAFLNRRTPAPEPLPEPDAKLAMGVLLVHVAKADQSYLFEEIAQIDRILAEANGLNAVEAAKMRATCEKIAALVKDDSAMAARIREAVPYDARLDKVTALWRVALADGITDDREAALMDLVTNVLGLSKDDATAARLAAG